MVSQIFYFHPSLGKWSNCLIFFQMGWNHHLAFVGLSNEKYPPENKYGNGKSLFSIGDTSSNGWFFHCHLISVFRGLFFSNVTSIWSKSAPNNFLTCRRIFWVDKNTSFPVPKKDQSLRKVDRCMGLGKGGLRGRCLLFWGDFLCHRLRAKCVCDSVWCVYVCACVCVCVKVCFQDTWSADRASSMTTLSE